VLAPEGSAPFTEHASRMDADPRTAKQRNAFIDDLR